MKILKYNLDAYLFGVNSANFTSECFCFTITEYCPCALLTVTILSSLRLNCFMFLLFPYWTNDSRLVACGFYGLSEACTITACDWLSRKMLTQQWCQPVYFSVLCMLTQYISTHWTRGRSHTLICTLTWRIPYLTQHARMHQETGRPCPGSQLYDYSPVMFDEWNSVKVIQAHTRAVTVMTMGPVL